MSHWNPWNVVCVNCEAKMEEIAERKSNHDGELILWCKNCGVLLLANKYDPISFSDWKMHKKSGFDWS